MTTVHGTGRLAAKRMREHAALFGAVFGVVAIVSGLGVHLVGYLESSATDGVRAEFSAMTGASAGIEVTLPREDDAIAQDVAIRQAIETAFSSNGRAVPLDIERSLGTLSESIGMTYLDGRPDPSESAGIPDLAARAAIIAKGWDLVSLEDSPLDGPPAAVVLSIPDLSREAALVDGQWPATTGEVSVQADAATLLDLEPGDRIQLGAAELTVSGTWRVLDVLDPRWLGNPLLTGGLSEDGVGPVVVAEDAWQDLEITPSARWVIVPIASELVPADLRIIAEVAGEIRTALLDSSEVELGPLSARGELAESATGVLTLVNALRAVQPVAVLAFLAIALITLVQLARMLANVRAAETELLWSRGADGSYFARSAALEATIVSALGSLSGAAIAVSILSRTNGAFAHSAADFIYYLAIPLLVAFATVVIFAVQSLVSSQRAVRRNTAVSSGRGRSAVGLGATMLVVAAATLSAWQLLLYGSPLTPTATGGTEIDPLAVLAPALVLVAVAMVGLLLFPQAARITERVAASTRTISNLLAFRNVSRRLRLAATPVVLLALASGQLVLTAEYASTWSHSFSEATELRAGAPIRIVGPSGLSDTTVDSISTSAGVDALAPARLERVKLGPSFEGMLGVPPLALDTIANQAGGAFDGAGAAREIDATVPGPVIPASAAEVRLETTTTGTDAPLAVLLHLSDALGVTSEVLLLPELASTFGPATTYIGDIPAGATGGWRVAAVDIRLAVRVDGQPTGKDAPTVALESLSTVSPDGTEEVSLGLEWVSRSMGDSAVPLIAVLEGHGFLPGRGAESVRMVPSFDGKSSDNIAAPVVISEALAAEYHLVVGDLLQVETDVSEELLSCIVRSIVPAIPGVSDDRAILIDLDVLTALELRDADVAALPTELWISAADPASTAITLRAALPGSERVLAVATDPSGPLLSSAVVALWLGAAGSALLALVAIGAVVGGELRTRRHEVVVLRAVGFGSRLLGAIRRRELALVLGYGLVLGVVAGLVVTFLTIPAFVGAAVPAEYASLPTTIRFDASLLAAVSLGLLALLAAMVVSYGARVSSQARTASAREEER